MALYTATMQTEPIQEDEPPLTPGQASIEVFELTDEDLIDSAKNALAEADLTLEEVRMQARLGRWSSPDARMAWWAVRFAEDGLRRPLW